MREGEAARGAAPLPKSDYRRAYFLKPGSPTYRLGDPVLKAIDDLAGELTGDRHFFHIGSSTGPNRT
jgi:hypothetical protein